MSQILIITYVLQLSVIVMELFFIRFFYRIYKEYPTISKWKIGIVGICLLAGYSTIQFLQDWTTIMKAFHQEIEVLKYSFQVLGILLLAKAIHSITIELIRIGYTDFLTQVYTKRYVKKQWIMEQKNFKNNSHKCSVLFLDVDNFKQVNETFGHEVGNKVLTELAQTIKESVRSIDTVGRYGGDEFIVLLSNTDGKQAEQILKRIQQDVLSKKFYDHYQIGISGGVAIFPDDGEDLNSLAEIADKRMYTQKTKMKESHNKL